jgi:hypothetical protein
VKIPEGTVANSMKMLEKSDRYIGYEVLTALDVEGSISFYLLHAGFPLALFLNPADAGAMFPRNVG